MSPEKSPDKLRESMKSGPKMQSASKITEKNNSMEKDNKEKDESENNDFEFIPRSKTYNV